jgi:hypothetical protein
VPPCTHIEICWDVLKLEVIHVNWLADLCCASSFQYNNGSDYLEPAKKRGRGSFFPFELVNRVKENALCSWNPWAAPF